MFEKEENIRFYVIALVTCGVVIVGAFALTPLRQQWAAFAPTGGDYAAIETGSISTGSETWGPRAWNSPRIPWRDFEDGVTEMALTGKPGLLVLQSSRCRLCPQYQEVFRSNAIQALANTYAFILVDADLRPDLQDRYNIDGDYVPRTFILDAQGDIAVARSGSHPAKRFLVDPTNSLELRRLMIQF